jgi:DNA-binding MarR family transcriptional regulator
MGTQLAGVNGNFPVDKCKIRVYTHNMESETQQSEAPALAEVEATCLCLNTRKMARVLTHHYEIYLQPAELRITQFSLLVAIALAQKVPLTRLAEVIAMDRTTLARNLKPLERQNLVRIETSTEDRRVRVITLTDQGHQKVNEALPLWKQAQIQVMSLLGSQRSQALLVDAQTVVERVPFSA